MLQYFPNITGSLTVSGDVIVSGSIATTQGITISGSIDSASYSSNSEKLDNLDSTAFVFTSSFNTYSSSMSTRTTTLENASASLNTASGSLSGRVTTIESKYATTGSNIFTGAQTVCANITSTGTIIAQTLNVQQVTSSIVYSSGSNIFGCSTSDVQQMTGSLRVSGSNALFNVGCVGIGNISPAANLHVLTPSTGTGVIFRYTGGTNNPGLFVSTEESTKHVRLTASGTSVAGQLLQLGAEGTAGVVNVGVANVGIGTPTNLNQRLTIVDSNDAEALGVYRCFSAASDAGTYFRLGALNGSGVPTAGAAIFGALEGAKTSGYLSFFTYCGSTAFERMRINSNGQAGIGVTPSAWGNTIKALQVASFGSISSTGGIDTQISNNAYYDGADWRYIAAQEAANYYMNRDTHVWRYRTAGGAGATITWCEAMRITSCGLLTINDTTASTNYKFAVKGASFLAGTNNKGVYITDTSTYASIVGLNKEISAYNPIELRASGTDYQLYLTTTGNVGIGTGNPIEKFEVCGNWGNIRTYGRGGVRLNNISNNLYYNGSAWVRDNGSYGAQGITFDTDGDLIFETTAATSGDTSPRMTIAGGGDISITCNVSISGNITLNTGANRILRLGSASAYYYDLQSVGDNFEIKEAGTTTRMKIFYPSGITCFSSTICAPCFATISDYRMKSNIRPIDGLSIIMNTKPYKFDYNYDCAPSFGMIAHELQEVVPEAVFGEKDGENMQGVDYMKLLPIAIKAIQELKCENDIFKTCLGIG